MAVKRSNHRRCHQRELHDMQPASCHGRCLHSCHQQRLRHHHQWSGHGDLFRHRDVCGIDHRGTTPVRVFAWNTSRR